MIDWVARALKESGLETMPEEWQRAWCAHEYVYGFFARAMNPAEPMPTNTNQNPLDLNEKVFLKGKCTIPGFESVVVQCTVSLSLFADPERILRRFYIFMEEPCKSTITTSEPCSPVFKEAQPRPSNIEPLQSVSQSV